MTMKITGIILSLILAPLLHGIINKTKAFFGGRKGQPLIQSYFDIIKLMRKGVVYSTSTSWIFRTAPVICLTAMISALFFMPYFSSYSLISFKGDIILFIYILALSRFVTVLAALDTGSSFEGMGAGREVFYSAIAEPAFLVALTVLVCKTPTLSLSSAALSMAENGWVNHIDVNILLAVALFIITLSENCRVPFDDPNTHLELTMIHEVMILDYSGPDLGFMLYTSAVKLWIFISLIILLTIPTLSVNPVLNIIVYLLEVFILAVIIGAVESVIARMNFLKVPIMLLSATVLSLLSLILIIRE